MYFCGILGDVWDGIIGNIYQAIRGMMYTICSLVYKLVILLYNLFDVLCHSRIMDNELVQQISARVGLILGLIMLFYVSFSFIKMLIDPDTITDKEKGAFNIVKKILIVIVLIGITPYLFDFAFDIQNKVLGASDSNSNVISRLLLPEIVDTDNFGGVFSSDIFLTFYKINPTLKDYSDDPEYIKCSNYINYLQKEIIENSEFDFGYNCLGADNYVVVSDASASGSSNVPVVDFNFILCFVVGLFVCWVLLTYCFSVGVRVIQLAFLQIISPMAIISYLSPKKDGMFQKWGKMCFTTYLDVFIRVGIINFIVLLIAYVINGFDNLDSTFWESIIAYKTVSSTTKGFLKVIMILALLQFAKKAPELLKDLFPNASVASGDFGFGLKNRSVLGGAIGKGLATVGGVAAGGAIGLVGGITGGNNWKNRITGAVGGFFGGATRGISGGLKTKGASIENIGKNISNVRKLQSSVNSGRAAAIAGGSTYWGRHLNSWQKSLGIETASEKDDREIGYLDTYSKFLDSMKSAADENGDIGKLKRAMNTAQSSGDQATFESLRKQYKNAQKAYISASLGDERFITRDTNGNITGFRYNDSDSDYDSFDANGNFVNKAGESVAGASKTFDVDDSSYMERISAIGSQANNYQSEHQTVFAGFKTVNTYSNIESNTTSSNTRRQNRVSSKSYEKNKANDKFSSKK